MTKNEMMELLNELERCGDVFIKREDDDICIDIHDFIGFDENWREEFREFSKPELVDRLEEIFEEFGDGDFYDSMELEGQIFVLGYTSYDI